MKQTLRIAALSVLALASARAAGCCTANTQAEDIAALQTRLEAQEKELAELRRTAERPAPEEVPTGLVLLCKGAGVPLEDVRWRVQAGLDPELAVQAAALQLAADQANQKGAR